MSKEEDEMNGKKQPTEAQAKAFWGRLGFRVLGVIPAGEPEGSLWPEIDMTGFAVYPGEQRARSLPSVDLNSLFEYVVPELLAAGGVLDFVVLPDGTCQVQVLPRLAFPDSFSEDKDPALALFWALFRALRV